ncbi:restriction endonuclease [Paenibacillus sp. 453mf]|uniref:restriction endonuclease n=1 Tax=Paenibacillus sp. 453mf TaxID=1761874 RepID=UPI0008F17E88|nr:restriction endonuclease [Paenibacillus sp. 453mf]SFS82869.1 Restriction endonuclease [Paenibacillus sp. 453mf]
MRLALLENKNISKVITVADYIPDFRDSLFCPTDGCNCKLVYVNSNMHEPYFRSHRNHSHSSSCPYIIDSYNQQAENITCYIDGCLQVADYEVYLYDYYAPPINQEFMELDFTCPYLCEHHMSENERQAIGKRVPRGSVTYPYSNKNRAQGYTKYIPINKSSIILDSANYQNHKEINLEVLDVNAQLIKYLAMYPELLREIDPRKFEEVVAEIFHKKGFTVTLTPRTRDGGKDIYAIQNGMFGRQLFVIECKRYSSTNKVGVELVRGIYGVKVAERATAAMLVTTSTFSKDAIDFASPLKYELSLKDYTDLKSWLKEYK